MRRYLWRAVEVGTLMLFVLLFFLLFAVSFRYIVPFVIGWLMAIVLLPIVKWLERHKVRRTLAVLMVVVGVVVCLLLISIFALVALSREATQLLMEAPNYLGVVQHWVQREVLAGRVFFGALPPNVANGIESTALTAAAQVESEFRLYAKHLLDSITRLPETVFIAVISVVSCFFMLLNREGMYHRFLDSLPPGWSGKLQGVFRDMMRAFVGTIRAQLLLMCMSAVLGVLGMWVMHIQYAVILGILFGLTGLVPILGSAILTVPWALGAFALGDATLGIKVLVLQCVISILRHIVEPKIVAENVGLDTLSTLFALYVGLKTIGVLGLFLGPIILIGLKSLVRARIFRSFFPTGDEIVTVDADVDPMDFAASLADAAPDHDFHAKDGRGVRRDRT